MATNMRNPPKRLIITPDDFPHVIRRPPRGWPYAPDAWFRLQYLNQTIIRHLVFQAREMCRAELRREYPYFRSAGGWVITLDKHGRGCFPFPDVEMCRDPQRTITFKMMIADIEQSYPDVHQIIIRVGFHATFVNVGFFGPDEPIKNWHQLWAKHKDILFWTRSNNC